MHEVDEYLSVTEISRTLGVNWSEVVVGLSRVQSAQRRGRRVYERGAAWRAMAEFYRVRQAEAEARHSRTGSEYTARIAAKWRGLARKCARKAREAGRSPCRVARAIPQDLPGVAATRPEGAAGPTEREALKCR